MRQTRVIFVLNWFKGEHSENLSSIVQHAEGLAYACITQRETQKPLLTACIFQSQISDSKTTLNQLLQQKNLTKHSVTTLLDSSNFLLLLMQRPAVEKQELPDAVRWQIKDQLDYPAEEAIIEILEIPGQQERGRLPMIYVIAAHQYTVKASIDLLEDIKINVQYIDIPELAQRNISSLLPEDLNGVALLNMQANNSLLTITHNGELFLSRIIDIGYEHLETHNEQEQESDGLSLEQSTSEFDINTSKVILEIQRSLDYYESHYGKPTIGNLVIAPLENDIPSLNKQLEHDLGVAVRSLDIQEIVDFESVLDIELQAKCFCAIGAALREAISKPTPPGRI